MVKLYTGTPGSGKSYHAAKEIYDKLRRRKNIISTMAIDVNMVSNRGRRKIGIYEFLFIQELTPKYLIEFAMRHHRIGKEGQTTVVIDECQIIFNSREYSNKGRAEWIMFFSMHRHYGFDVILITQQDRMLDRQIRGLAETEYRHRKLNNRGMLFLLPVKVFVVIEYWYVNKTRLGAHFVRYRRSVSRIYNSYESNDIIAQKLGVAIEWNHPATQPVIKPAATGDGGRGSPSRGRAGKVTDWLTNGLKEAAVKY